MNHKLKVVIFILLLFIPTYLAVAAYITSQDASVEDSRDVVKMSIVDPDGGTYIFSPENEGEDAEELNREAASEIAFLTAMNKNAKAQEMKPDAIAEAKTFTVTYDGFNRSSVYEYYFTEDPGAAFFRDPDGIYYKITSEDASAFLCKDYAACLYNGSVYPVLTIGDATVLPLELDWRYQLFNGTYRPLETETTPEMHNYRMNARLSFSFNLEPDVIDISVYDGENMIYKDNYANLSQISITEQKQLRFHIEAKWYEVDGKEGQGEAVYDFMATVNAPASFYLNTTTITNGEFCVITVKDKPEDADILFTAEPDLGGFEPTFVEDGDYYRALVPVNYANPAGIYTFTLSCDGVTQELVLNVAEYEYLETSMTVAQSVIDATRTEATLASYDDIMTPVASSLNIGTDHLFEGTFSRGVPDGTSIRAGYGRIRVINGGASYQNPGVVYMVSEGHEVSAVNNGVVIYVGETDLSGVTVVVEHGLGLKSWYKNLSEAVVEVGDTVNKGDLLAYSGETGFCDMASVQIDLTVFGVPVCPYSLWDNAIPINNP
ncbi:MAG: M23 family metallopeptidase [Clostridia bacterium]|nr:M23 family metallopeptidase [Clostridia bacterium]